MATSPGGGNQGNFSPGIGGLPNVSAQDPVSAAYLNKISEAIMKVAPSGPGFTTTPTGTVFKEKIKFGRHYYPWMVTRKADHLFIEPGNFFINAPLAGGVNQVTNGTKLGGGRNAWLFNSAIGSNAPYANTAPKGFYMGGAEIWFEDEFMNVLSNKQMFIGMDTLWTKARAGLYYIEYAAWGGRQMKSPYENTGGQPALAGFNASISSWNAYSMSMKGRVVPQFRFAPEKESDAKSMLNIKQFVYPICTIDEYGNVFQGVRGDIFYTATPMKPFEVTLMKEDSGWKAVVYPGLVNQIVPKIGSKYLDELPVPTLSIAGAGRIYLKATHEAKKFFPRNIEVVYNASQTVPEDTETAGYYQIASIAPIGQSFAVTQLSTGNKLVNRFKMGASGAYWSWSA